MAKIRDLPLDPLAKRWFEEERLDTSDDLWRAIGPDYPNGMAGVEARTRIARDRLVHALGSAAAAGPERRITPGEVLAAAVAAVLLVLAGLRAAEALGALPFPLPGLSAKLDQAVIVPREGLPAFHVLAESDLRLAPRPRTAGGITRRKDAAGRYLLRPLAAGAVVHAGDLGPAPLAPEALAGRSIVTLRAGVTSLGPQVAPGARLILVLSPGPGSPRAAVEADVLVLALDRGTGRMTVAIARDRRAEVAAALGSSALFLAREAEK